MRKNQINSYPVRAADHDSSMECTWAVRTVCTVPLFLHIMSQQYNKLLKSLRRFSKQRHSAHSDSPCLHNTPQNCRELVNCPYLFCQLLAYCHFQLHQEEDLFHFLFSLYCHAVYNMMCLYFFQVGRAEYQQVGCRCPPLRNTRKKHLHRRNLSSAGPKYLFYQPRSGWV